MLESCSYLCMMLYRFDLAWVHAVEDRCIARLGRQRITCMTRIGYIEHMAHFQLGSFLIGLVSNRAQF